MSKTGLNTVFSIFRSKKQRKLFKLEIVGTCSSSVITNHNVT